MSGRRFTTASWGSFVALVAVLHFVGSCSGGSDESSESAPDPTGESPSEASTAPDNTDAIATTTEAEPTAFQPPSDNPELFSEWHQLGVQNGELNALEGVTPYTLNSPLFSDYAHKLRTVWIPGDAEAAQYDAAEMFDFPVGTVVTKTFYYPTPTDGSLTGDQVLRADQDPNVIAPLDLNEVRLIETRVLVHRDDGWHGLPYVWNTDETDATLQRTGDLLRLELVDEGAATPLTYVVPDVNQCANCHAVNHSTGNIELIGVKARHLNTDVDIGQGMASQLDQWRNIGLLADAPPAADIPSAAVWNDDGAPLEDRARAYLDINCAHCHNPVGAADTSGLFLDIETEVGFSFGVCKPPVAAGSGTGGRLVDISPGEPDESILIYRMESTDPSKMMPEIGRSASHVEGVDVVAEWIASLEGAC